MINRTYCHAYLLEMSYFWSEDRPLPPLMLNQELINSLAPRVFEIHTWPQNRPSSIITNYELNAMRQVSEHTWFFKIKLAYMR